MKTHIALLRGINVGGHRKVPMADLRALLTKHGFNDVATYIQSGNVILKSKASDKRKVAEKIRKAILDHFGFEVSVLVKTRYEIQSILEACPFPISKKEDSYFTMMDAMPSKAMVDEVTQIDLPNEEIQIINDCLYFYCSNGYGQAKFNSNRLEKKYKIAMTSRNYRTMMKLLSLSEESLAS